MVKKKVTEGERENGKNKRYKNRDKCEERGETERKVRERKGKMEG